MSSKTSPNQPDLFADAPKPLASKKNTVANKERSCNRCLETYLPDHAVAKRYGVSRAAIWRWVDSIPTFPSPIKLTRGTTRWRLSELVTYESGCARRGMRPKQDQPS